jgi:hypothetical protein
MKTCQAKKPATEHHLEVKTKRAQRLLKEFNKKSDFSKHSGRIKNSGLIFLNA